MKVQESVDIARPPEDVWSVVADPMSDPRWCRKVRAVAPAGPGRWLVSHKPVPFRPPVELTVEHLELEAPMRLRMREEDDASVFAIEYRLQRTATGTRFTQVSDFEFKTLPRLLRSTYARGVRRDVRGQLRALRKLLESP